MYQSLDDTPVAVEPSPTYEREPMSDPEDNEVTYIVTIEPSEVDLFLIVSDTNIREKDALSGR